MDKFSEPNDNLADAMNSLRGWKQIAEAAEKRISALLAELEAKDKHIAELEQRLATPVRLPEGTGWASDPYNHGHNTGIHECAEAIRAAGFKCAGDE